MNTGGVVLLSLLLLVSGYFVLRGIRLSLISSFGLYLKADIIEYVLPFVLIFTQSFLIAFSIVGSPWNGLLAAGLVLGAGALNSIGREQRGRWENKTQEAYPNRWTEWERRRMSSGLVGLVDRLCRYTSNDTLNARKE